MEFLLSLPKHTLAMIVIAVGILFIILNDPPVTVCGQQIKSYEASQVGYLVKDASKPLSQTSRFDRLLGVCLQANSFGGCYEFFQSVRESLDKSRLTSMECMAALGESSVFEMFMKKSLDAMIKLAWGEKPPAAASLRQGWFEGPQVDLFCRLKNSFEISYGERPWANLREQYLLNLPGAKDLGREEAWGRSLFSVACNLPFGSS